MEPKCFRRSVAALLLAVTVSVLAAAEPAAIVRDVSGKVEFRWDHETWQPAVVGTVIHQSMMISTGFSSHAVLTLGAATVRVEPLTRLRLEELVVRNDTQRTDLQMRVGKVKAEVRTAEGLRHDFQIRSPVSTAAVRGTVFEFDGISVHVEEGAVALQNALSHAVTVGAGERSYITGPEPPGATENTRQSEQSVSLDTGTSNGRGNGGRSGGVGGGPGDNRGQGGLDRPDRGSEYGEIIIRWQK